MKTLRLAVLGDKNVGKTSFIRSLTNEGSNVVRVEPMWTQTEFELVDGCLDDIHCAILMFSMTSKESLINIREWAELARSKNPDVQLYILGTKRDIEPREVYWSMLHIYWVINKLVIFIDI